MADKVRIGVVAPGSAMRPDAAERIQALAADLYPQRAPEIYFHPQCFLTHGHFAGPDEARAQAFVEIANDPSFDALWCGRGGYGACRMAELALPRLEPAARDKAYLGYSDFGCLLAGLYRAGFEHCAHGPVVQDLFRPGGEAAARRALSWLVERDPAALEPSLAPGTRALAFNMAILSQILGTPLEPPMAGHVLMLEEVSEHMYRIDRFMFHITSNPAVRQAAGIRLGRCSDIPPNEPDFGMDEEAVVRHWCERSGIPFLGRADIGHDAGNKVVPFG